MSRPLLVAVTRAWETDLVTTLGGSRSWEVARRCPDLADLLAAASAGVAEVALVSADLRLLDRSALADLAAAGIGVLGVHPPGDEAAQRRLRQWGLIALTPADAALPQLEAALQTAYERRGELLGDQEQVVQDPPGDLAGIAASQADLLGGPRRVMAAPGPDDLGAGGGPGAIVVAVWGPAGAPGRSTLARNLAAEVAATGTPTLLLDADPYGGTQAQALALLNEAPGLLAASRAADQGLLDLPALARLSPYACPELRILTGIPSAARWPELRPAPLRQILALARSLSEVVVVDCGFCLEEDEELSYDTRAPRRNAATLTVLRAADRVVVVGGADPIALQRLVRGLAELTEVLDPMGAGAGGAGQAVRTVVVNRVREAAVGDQPGDRIRSALARFGGVEDVTLLPDDAATVDGALLAGQTLAEFAPGTPVHRAIADLARQLRGSPESGSRRDAGEASSTGGEPGSPRRPGRGQARHRGAGPGLRGLRRWRGFGRSHG